MLTEIVLALGYNRIDKRLPANETKHSQTRKEIETKHSQTILKPYLIQHILAKTCTQNAFFLFKKKKSITKEKCKTRKEHTKKEKKKTEHSQQKREKKQKQSTHKQKQFGLVIYLFIFAGNLWRWNNGGGAMEEEIERKKRRFRMQRETHTHTNGETNGLNTKCRERESDVFFCWVQRQVQNVINEGN